MKTMSCKITGLDKLQKRLKDLQQRAEALEGERQVPFSELYNADFMHQHTKASSFEEFLIQGGYGTTKEEFEAIPDAEFDKYVRENTDFASWIDMQKGAMADFVSKQLGF